MTKTKRAFTVPVPNGYPIQVSRFGLHNRVDYSYETEDSQIPQACCHIEAHDINGEVRWRIFRNTGGVHLLGVGEYDELAGAHERALNHAMAESKACRALHIKREAQEQRAEKFKADADAEVVGFFYSHRAGLCDDCGETRHTSDCAVHPEPAEPKGPCSCGAIDAEK